MIVKDEATLRLQDALRGSQRRMLKQQALQVLRQDRQQLYGSTNSNETCRQGSHAGELSYTASAVATVVVTCGPASTDICPDGSRQQAMLRKFEKNAQAYHS